MTEFKAITFDSYEEEKKNLYKTLPPGEYDLQLSKWSYKEMGEDSKPGLNFQFIVVQNEDPELNGESIFHWVGLNSPYMTKIILFMFGEEIKDFRIDSLEELKNGSNESLNSILKDIITVEVTERTFKTKAGEDGKSNNIKFDLK